MSSLFETIVSDSAKFAKILILHIARAVGLFRLCRKLTANGTRILCYHGLSFRDEDAFRPKLFISPEVFRERLKKIQSMGFRVISLDAAVKALKTGIPQSDSVVLTFDDGWQSTHDLALPVLAEFRFPFTVYLASYYSLKQTQISNLIIQYLCWKTSVSSIKPGSLCDTYPETLHFNSSRARQTSADVLQGMCRGLDSASDRQAFVDKLAGCLEVDNEAIKAAKLFHLLDRASCLRIMDSDGDIELHTHRHRLPEESQQMMLEEIEDNVWHIRKALGVEARHFCFPSGKYSPKQLEWLRSARISSATTCIPGFAGPESDLLELPRFLDGSNIDAIEFEAELSGFLECARKIRNWIPRQLFSARR